MGADWGKNIQLSIFGESHGKVVGINIGGLPAGIKLDFDYINSQMARRKPGNGGLSTPRKESDAVEILSGVYDGYTTGAPLCAVIKNENQNSKDYSYLKELMRPGHSDYPAFVKYHGFNDVRGGGRFSGRLTAPLVFAGSVARQILRQKGIVVTSHIQSVGGVRDEKFPHPITNDLIKRLKAMEYPLICREKSGDMEKTVTRAKEKGNSVGGSIQCAVIGLPAGIGDPFFDSVESKLSSILFSVPAVKAVEFGDGFDLCQMDGSRANDEYAIENRMIITKTNHNGGILGGITNGSPVVFTVGIKPTPSISIPQNTVNVKTMTEEKLTVTGRHDRCIVYRALPVIESVAALAVLDMVNI